MFTTEAQRHGGKTRQKQELSSRRWAEATEALASPCLRGSVVKRFRTLEVVDFDMSPQPLPPVAARKRSLNSLGQLQEFRRLYCQITDWESQLMKRPKPELRPLAEKAVGALNGARASSTCPFANEAFVGVGGIFTRAQVGTVKVPADAGAVHMNIAEALFGISKLPPAMSTVAPDEAEAVQFTVRAADRLTVLNEFWLVHWSDPAVGIPTEKAPTLAPPGADTVTALGGLKNNGAEEFGETLPPRSCT
jgi:hypothetical protein